VLSCRAVLNAKPHVEDLRPTYSEYYDEIFSTPILGSCWFASQAKPEGNKEWYKYDHTPSEAQILDHFESKFAGVISNDACRRSISREVTPL